MERLSICITGRLGSEPRLSTTNQGTPKLTMSVAVEPRDGQDGPTRWFIVNAYRNLAARTAESVHTGDTVIVKGNDVRAYTWTDDRTKEARAGLAMDAYDIGVSTRTDTVVTGAVARRAAQASTDTPSDAEQEANLAVLSGVTR